MNSSIEHLSQAITPECAGIIWLTNKKLDYSMSGVYEFNYLLDGLLTKSIASSEQSPGPNLFIAQNFGNSFFLGHSIVTNLNELDVIKKHLTVVNSMIDENKTVLFYNDVEAFSAEEIQSNLSKKFNHIRFSELRLN